MNRLKKIFYFLLGGIVIPVVLGRLLSLLLKCEEYEGVNFFGVVYFFIYLIFPVLYGEKVKRLFPNKYVFYGVVYLPFIMLFVWLYMQ